MKRKVKKIQSMMRAKLRTRGYKVDFLEKLDEFDLSMLLDGYSPDEVITLRRIYF